MSPATLRRLLPRLGPRDFLLLRWLSTDASQHDIAAQLCITPKTVRNRMNNVYRALEVHSRTDAVARYQMLLGRPLPQPVFRGPPRPLAPEFAAPSVPACEAPATADTDR